MSKTHRCEHVKRSAVRVSTGGQVNRNKRCENRETVVHVRNLNDQYTRALWARRDADYKPWPTEAWFCADHTHTQTRGVTDWIPANMAEQS